MSAWRARLAELTGETVLEPPSCQLTKLPKAPSVSFDSEQDGSSRKIAALDGDSSTKNQDPLAPTAVGDPSSEIMQKVPDHGSPRPSSTNDDDGGGSLGSTGSPYSWVHVEVALSDGEIHATDDS